MRSWSGRTRSYGYSTIRQQWSRKHMGTIIGDTGCPQCIEQGRDSTHNHLMIFDDGGAHCNRCGYTEPKGSRDEDGEPTGEPTSPSKRVSNESNSMTLDEVQKLPVAALKARGIDKDICEKEGVRVEYNTSTGEEKGYYYPVYKNGQIIAHKNRVLPKDFYWVGSVKGKKPELFGQHTCQKGGKKLLICGGQDDYLAAKQMLWRKYPNFPPNVVSLIHGESASSAADNLDFINSYEEVLIYTDMDEVGRKCASEIAELVGEKARIVETSEKDANDMLRNSKSAEFINAFFSAKPYAPVGFVTVDDVWEEATAMPEWGKKWPWPTLTKLTYGRRLGEGIYFGAGVKVGKSEAVNQIAHHVTQVEEGKIALFKLEEKPAMTARKIAGKIMHKQFHVPDGPFTQEELKEGVEKVRGGVVMYDSYGSTSWDDLKKAIRHAVKVEGCEDIVIDPLTRLTSGMNSAEANTELERISDELSKMAKDLGFFYMVFAHLKAPQTGKPHEEGGKVHSNQFTGSRAMMRACYYMVGIQRDKTLEDEVERNTSTFVLLEDRAFGNSGLFEVFYNRETGDYLEPVNDFKGEY
jgi:twinkle protein